MLIFQEKLKAFLLFAALSDAIIRKLWLLVQVPNIYLKFQGTFTVLSIFFTVGYVVVIAGLCLNSGVHKESTSRRHAPWNLDGKSKVAGIFDALAALGTFVFPYTGHSVIVELQVHALQWIIPSSRFLSPTWMLPCCPYVSLCIEYFSESQVDIYWCGLHLQAKIPDPYLKPTVVGAALGYLLSGLCLALVSITGYWVRMYQNLSSKAIEIWLPFAALLLDSTITTGCLLAGFREQVKSDNYIWHICTRDEHSCWKHFRTTLGPCTGRPLLGREYDLTDSGKPTLTIAWIAKLRASTGRVSCLLTTEMGLQVKAVPVSFPLPGIWRLLQDHKDDVFNLSHNADIAQYNFACLASWLFFLQPLSSSTSGFFAENFKGCNTVDGITCSSEASHPDYCYSHFKSRFLPSRFLRPWREKCVPISLKWINQCAMQLHCFIWPQSPSSQLRCPFSVRHRLLSNPLVFCLTILTSWATSSMFFHIKTYCWYIAADQ